MQSLVQCVTQGTECLFCCAMNVCSHDLFSREGWIIYPSCKIIIETVEHGTSCPTKVVESVEHRHPVSYKKCENRGTRTSCPTKTVETVEHATPLLQKLSKPWNIQYKT